MKRLFLLLLILLTNFAFTYTNQPVSRNLDPENHPIENYDVYKDSHVLKTGKFVVEYESKASRNEKLLVIVEDSIYPEIRDNLLIYTRDNENEGINVDVVTYDGTLISELKSFIVDEYYENSISGLFFIGDLPSAWYEMTEDFDPEDDNESFVQFPIDLFFTDIDGIWIDANGNDVFDEHSGEVHPELYLGRIKADNLSLVNQTEAELINSYFERNHRYRLGFDQGTNTALAYIDDDWSSWGEYYQDIIDLMPYEGTVIAEVNETNRDDYVENRLPNNYDLIQVHVHSAPDAHYFYENDGASYYLLYNYELVDVELSSIFYNLFCCSNARYETENNMGSLYLLSDDRALGVIGSTKTGSMLSFEEFYQPFGDNMRIGEAFKSWWENAVDTGDNTAWERSWFYGMTNLGDPTIRAQYQNQNIVYVDVNAVGLNDGTLQNPYNSISLALENAAVGQNIVINSGTYYEHDLSISQSNTSLRAVENGEVIINGENNQILTINADHSYIEGISFTNGNSTEAIINVENYVDTRFLLCNFYENNVNAESVIKCLENGSFLQNCVFSDNGKVFHIQNSTLDKCRISENSEVSLIKNSTIETCLVTESNLDVVGNTVINNSTFHDLNITSSENSMILINNSIFAIEENSYDANNNTIEVESSCFTNGLNSFENSSNVGFEESNIAADPLFENVEAKDFTLSNYSPCIGAGMLIGNEYDFLGVKRYENPDIGAFENHKENPSLHKTFVSENGSDSNLGTYENPLASIQTAISKIAKNDTIIVLPGTYVENIIISKPLKLYSNFMISKDVTDIYNTQISGNNYGVVIAIQNTSENDIEVAGFRIVDGQASLGAGILISGIDAKIHHCLIENNEASSGAAIGVRNNAKPILSNLTIRNNVSNNDIGAIFNWNSEPLIINSIIYGNEPTTISDNVLIVNSCTDLGLNENNNISVDPNMMSQGYLNETSLCIDAGVNSYSDINFIYTLDNEFYSGSNPDIGAFEYNATSIEENYAVQIKSQLLGNYPNPFSFSNSRNSGTQIRFNLEKESNVQLDIFNVKGQKITSLINKKMPKGEKSVSWSATLENKKLGSGVYFYKLRVDGKVVDTKKCLLIK